jgi:hypothetical protein
MNRLIKQSNDVLDWLPNPRFGLRQRMALALIGQEVSLKVNAKTIEHGIVTDVLGELDFPQIVVGRGIYDMDQVLTHVPAAFSQAPFQPNTATTTKK